MFAHIMTEWVELAVRWLHVVAGIAWIGTSFYFNFLNNSLRPPPEPDERISGELWAVHGGGFYHVEKFKVAPERLPEKLHWFKWEAYTTWLSGFSLLVLVYYMGPGSILVDREVADISRATATAIGVGALVVGWFGYDLLCRSRLISKPMWFAGLLFVLFVAAAYGFSQVLAGRAAYIHVGALLGSIMVANVFRVIIPSQKDMVAAMADGREPDGRLGQQASLRSLHNNYFTLPVIYIMISSHFPSTFGNARNWLILAGISLAGVLIRHWFNLRGQGRRNRYLLPTATVLMVALAFTTAPSATEDPAVADAEPISDERGFGIIQTHCAACHAATPTQPGMTSAPRGIEFDSIDQVSDWADAITTVAVRSEVMPPGNLTDMSDQERAELGRWLDQRD